MPIDAPVAALPPAEFPVESSVEPPPASFAPPGPDASMQERIARRAYELYEQRGRAPGFDADDWYAAERELLGGEHESRLDGGSGGGVAGR